MALNMKNSFALTGRRSNTATKAVGVLPDSRASSTVQNNQSQQRCSVFLKRAAPAIASLSGCSSNSQTNRKARLVAQATSGAQQSPTTGAHFSLPLAVGLAGTSFHAYLQPVGANGYQDRALNGTETVFTDSAFLTEVYQGILYVELISAKNLKVADITGASDPYVVMTMSGSAATSKVIYNTINPKWGERFFLYVAKTDQDILKIRVYDKDLLKSDDDLGTYMLSIAKYTDGKPHDLDVQLQGPGAGENSTVQMRVMMMRFADFPEQMLDKMAADKTAIPEPGGPGNKEMPEMMKEVIRSQQAKGKMNGGELQLHEQITGVISNIDTAKQQASKMLEDVAKMAGWQQAQDNTPPNPWKVLAHMAGVRAEMYNPVAFVESHETDTQVWLFRNVANKEAVVAFRGTEQVKWKDIVTDLNLAPCSLNPERIDDSSGLPFTMRVLKAISPTDTINVHKGFMTGYDSVRQQVVSLLDAITGTGDKGTWKVRVTGHSLGGALATLCAYELAARQSPARKAQQISMYTFGAPRVGNKSFAHNFDELVPDSWRITNKNDIVPSVPRLLGYAHVKHSVQVTEDGRLRIQADSKDVFGEGRSGVDVIMELVDKVQGEGGNWEDVYEEIKSKEMAMLDTLVDGKALEEHMEDFYLATLRQCVLASTTAAAGAAAGSPAVAGKS